jgi:hypothetical protein
MNEYVLVKANKGSVNHLASVTNLENNKYYIGCGSFNSDRMKTVIVLPLKVEIKNVGCKKCKTKLDQLIKEQNEESKQIKTESELLKEWGTIIIKK